MRIKKIISGGQTGADRAALDFAIKSGIPYGGWVPKGRIAEDGIIPETYELHEAPTQTYERRTELNVVNSDGTLIISRGELSGGSAMTKKLAEVHHKPCLHINLTAVPDFRAAIDIKRWMEAHDVGILNVAGPRASKDPDIYDAVMKILEAVFLLRVTDDDVSDLIYRQFGHKQEPLKERSPEIVDHAVDRLIAEMPLKDKVRLAAMAEDDLKKLHSSLELYIRNNFRLWDDSRLLESCRELSGNKDLQPDEAARLIIRQLWEKLKTTHRIRIA